jgi:hypothetical protein
VAYYKAGMIKTKTLARIAQDLNQDLSAMKWEE